MTARRFTDPHGRVFIDHDSLPGTWAREIAHTPNLKVSDYAAPARGAGK
jgi:hypothetical protein